jgi:TonB-dependent receptor
MLEPSFNHYIDYATSEAVATRDAAGNLTGAGGIVPGYTKTVTEWRAIPASTVTANSSFEWKHVGSVHAEIGAVHKFRGLDVDYNLYKSVSTTNYPHNDQTNIIATGIGLRLEDTGDPNLPRLTQTGGPDITNPNSYSTVRRDLRVAQGKDAFEGAAINIKKSFETVVPMWVKAGVRLRTQNRDLFADQFRWNYVGRDGVTGLNPATGINDDNLAQFVNPDIRRWGGLDKYPLLPTLNWATWGFNPGGSYKPGSSLETGVRDTPALFVEDVELRTRTALAARQKFEESINAAYIMGNLELGKLQITAGLRVEETKTEGDGAKNEVTPAEAALRAAFAGPLTTAEIIRRTTAQYSGRQKAKGDYREVFPGVHFKYNVSNNLLVRASYSTNIGRPAIGQLIPNTTVDNIRRSLVISNPSLKPQHANNFDLGVEYYFEPVGVFSAGVFLKEIKQFIFTRSGDIIQGNTGEYAEYTGYTFSSQFNGGAARVRGFELAYQQQFTFLPGVWKGFGVYANYSRNETEGDYGGTVSTTKVAGFIPETANAGVSYIRFPLTIRFQYNYVGRRLVGVSAAQARLNYRRATGISDIKTVYEINKNFSVYLDAWNIFDVQELSQEFEGGRRGRNFRTGPQVLGGINWRY